MVALVESSRLSLETSLSPELEKQQEGEWEISCRRAISVTLRGTGVLTHAEFLAMNLTRCDEIEGSEWLSVEMR